MMTYGWIVVVGVGAVVLLSQMGTFRPSPCEKNRFGFSQVIPLDWGVFRDSNVIIVKLENLAGNQIEVTNATVVLGNITCVAESSIVMDQGTDAFLKLICANNPRLSVIYNRGDCYRADGTFKYTDKVTGFSDESKGNIRGVIEEGNVVTTTTVTTTTTTTTGLFDDAKYISQVIPKTMLSPGEVMAVTVTMKNNGTTTWSFADNYKLSSQSPPDSMFWGLNRVSLAPGETIAPGSSKTFSFSITAPMVEGTYNFQWRMITEKAPKHWFGEFTPLVLITVYVDHPPTVLLISPPNCHDVDNNPVTIPGECLNGNPT